MSLLMELPDFVWRKFYKEAAPTALPRNVPYKERSLAVNERLSMIAL
jgi:hypothetical protein